MNRATQLGEISAIIIKDTRKATSDIDLAITIPLVGRTWQMQDTQWTWVMEMSILGGWFRIEEASEIRGARTSERVKRGVIRINTGRVVGSWSRSSCPRVVKVQ